MTKTTCGCGTTGTLEQILGRHETPGEGHDQCTIDQNKGAGMITNRVNRVGIGDKVLEELMGNLTREGFQVVAVHAIAGKFFVFSTRVET